MPPNDEALAAGDPDAALRSRIEDGGHGHTAAAHDHVLFLSLIGELSIGFAAHSVIEVAPGAVVAPLPGASSALLGVVVIRGRVVPVVSMASYLRQDPRQHADQAPRLLVVASALGEFAVPVTRTLGMFAVHAADFRSGDGGVVRGVGDVHTAAGTGAATWVVHWLDADAIAERVKRGEL